MKKFILFLILLYSIKFELKAQTPNQSELNAQRLFNKGFYTQSIVAYENAANLYLSSKDTVSFLFCYNQIASILEGNLSNVRSFLNYSQKLKPFFNYQNAEVAYLSISFGNAFYDNGDFINAIQFYKRAIQLSKKINYSDVIFIATCTHNIGNTYFSIGDFENAIIHFNQAIILLENSKRKDSNIQVEKGKFLISYGRAYEHKNNFVNAEKKYLLAVEVLKNTQSNEIEKALNNLSTLYLKQKQFDLALKYISEAEKYIKNDISALARNKKNKASIQLEKKDYIQAKTNIYTSIKLRNIKNDKYGLGLSYKLLGDYFLKTHQNDSARIIYLRAIQQFSQNKLKYKKELVETITNYINVIPLKNKIMVFQTIFQADSLIDLMRKEHTEQGSKLFWREKTHTFYENAIETCYRLKDYDKAFYFMEKSRAILLLDALKDLDAKKILSVDKQSQEQNLRYKIIGLQAKLENKPETDKNYTKIYQQLFSVKEEYNTFIQSLEKTNREYYQLKYENKYISLPTLQSALWVNNQSFIEYFIGEKAVYAFLVTAKDTRMIKIDLHKYQVLSKQFLLLTSQKPPHTSAQLKKFYGISNQLYQLVFAPLKIPLGRVIISQDNYFLPFSALVSNASSPKFLVEDYAFSYSYSANIVFREKETQISFNKNMLGFSPIHYNKSLNLNTLSGSDQVLNSIEDKYFSGKVFLEKQATKQNFIQNASDYKIIQLFTHGKADTVSDKSRIYFYDDALNMSELYQLEKLKAELVVLSACETNLGSNATGEGIMSFARGFAYLGVPSTVSTLWSVNNQSTYQLTESFYKYLKDGYEKDIALQMAQKDYLNKSGYRFPYYWSGVVLVGDSTKTSNLNIYLAVILILGIILPLLVFLIRRGAKFKLVRKV
ncbi:MAG: CHAT domain-containing protein [Spirosomaceae bacterium]|jgi:CHAT domain-containing protein|nr:CHAT domain-containing protein [Spirosomataceae bacterium]